VRSRAGLRPSRVPVWRAAGDRAQAGDYKSDTTPTSGGRTGLDLDITFSTTGTPAAGLQIVQTVMTTRDAGPQVGKMSWNYDGKLWDGFVDGGKNSPYAADTGAPADPNKPYYLTAGEVTAGVVWDKDHGTIRTTDEPTAANAKSEVHFETAVVAIDHDGSGRDKLLKAFKWGWIGKGTHEDFPQGTNVGGKPSGLLVRSVVTPEFTNIVRHDYPQYKLD
jgi:hypothetical protein